MTVGGMGFIPERLLMMMMRAAVMLRLDDVPTHPPACHRSPRPHTREVAERLMSLREYIAKEMVEDLEGIRADNATVFKRCGQPRGRTMAVGFQGRTMTWGFRAGLWLWGFRAGL